MTDFQVSPSPSHDYTVSHLTENEPGKFQIRIEKVSKPSQGLDVSNPT